MAGRSRPRWGFHRLDDGWARLVVERAGVKPGELVVDIGAGDGRLTRALVEAGARVVAVERHPTRAALLRGRFSSDPVCVVQADATDLRLPKRPFRVVSNPPFSAAKPVLRRLLANGSRMTAADLVLPRHVVRQWASPYAPGAQRWGQRFAVRRGATIPAEAFSPMTVKDAAVLVLRLLPQAAARDQGSRTRRYAKSGTSGTGVQSRSGYRSKPADS